MYHYVEDSLMNRRRLIYRDVFDVFTWNFEKLSEN